MEGIDHTPSRRDFLISSAWIALNLPAIQAAAAYGRRAARSGQAFQALSKQEATELDNIAAQILPTDDTPGAREAGVIHFIDRALATFASDLLQAVRDGLDELQSTVQEKYPGAVAFSELSFDHQTEVVRQIEDTEFFSSVHFLTVAGTFANPSYGGNRDEIGWKLLGFENRPAFRPPFGYYDARYKER